MKDEADNWMSWLDDLPVQAEFDEGIGRLQEYISALRAALDAAEARERQAVEAAEYILDGMGIDGPEYVIDPDDDYLEAAVSHWVRDTLERLAAAIRTGAKP